MSREMCSADKNDKNKNDINNTNNNNNNSSNHKHKLKRFPAHDELASADVHMRRPSQVSQSEAKPSLACSHHLETMQLQAYEVHADKPCDCMSVCVQLALNAYDVWANQNMVFSHTMHPLQNLE